MTEPEKVNLDSTDIMKEKRERLKKLFPEVFSEEPDECAYWLEIIMDSGMLSEKQTAAPHAEADEPAAIFYSTLRTSKNAKWCYAK